GGGGTSGLFAFPRV
nr:RecName: Full=CAPA-Periviscerokinin-1; Short=CAPA-PVK-1 [Delia radicum]